VGTINTTDPDSRLVKTVGQRALQGYNAQAAVNEHQIIVAAEVTVDSPDFGHLEPMVDATARELARAGAESPAVVIADAGYWHKRQMENVVCRGIQVLIPPDSGLRKSARPGSDGGLYAFMRRVLSTEQGKALYRKRQATVEPVFGQIKFNRRFDRFLRRGRLVVRSEWRLFSASHNLLKLHSHRMPPPEPNPHHHQETILPPPSNRTGARRTTAATQPSLFPTATARQAALPKTPGHDRAGVREHQVQSSDRSLPTSREIRHWHHDKMDALAGRGIQVLVPPDAGKRRGARPGWDGGRYAFMRRVLETDHAKALYRNARRPSSRSSGR
jgi:DDE family transposase